VEPPKGQGTDVERITADELRELARQLAPFQGLVARRLRQAADTIDDLDKDIAVFEAQIVDMQHEHCNERMEDYTYRPGRRS
jgi:hypothetical protein